MAAAVFRFCQQHGTISPSPNQEEPPMRSFAACSLAMMALLSSTSSGAERVLVENCHGTRMASECFYSQSNSRSASKEPKAYTKAITYLRCSAEDCGRNAFNNNGAAGKAPRSAGERGDSRR